MVDLRFKPVAAVRDVDNDSDFRSFISAGAKGIRFVPEPLGHQGAIGLQSDFGDFAKWLAQRHPEVPATVAADAPRVVLRNSNVWLPLIHLAADTSVQIFLNMAASYLYDRAKGALKHETPKINLSIVYLDKSAGKTKRFEFSGDAEALHKAVKRFDLNNFFDDTL